MTLLLIRAKLSCWRRSSLLHARPDSRFILAAAASLCLAAIMFVSSSAVISAARTAGLSALPAASLLGLLFLGLFSGLLFLDLADVLETFYTSDDMLLLLPAPVPPLSMFLARLAEVAAAPRWLISVVIIPSLAAFAFQYSLGAWFIAASLLVLLPLLIIPALIALALLTVGLRVMPLGRIRRLLYTGLLVLLLAVCLVGPHLYPLAMTLSSSPNTQMLGLLMLPQAPWLPSYWAAETLGALADGQTARALFAGAVLFAATAAGGAAVYLTFRTVFSKAYSNFHSAGPRLAFKIKSCPYFLHRLPINQPLRAVLGKEIKNFLRDWVQTLHLVLLLGIAVMYVSSLTAARNKLFLSPSVQVWFDAGMIAVNILSAVLLTAAVAGRFAFVSIAAEKNSFWLLAASPLKPLQVLHAKFITWLVFLLPLTALVAASGAAALRLSAGPVLFSAITASLTSYGIIGAAVGLGAYFCLVQPDASLRLSPGVGAVCYFAATVLICALNLSALLVLVFVYAMDHISSPLSPLEWAVCLGSSLTFIFYVNMAVAKWAMRAGASSLHPLGPQS